MLLAREGDFIENGKVFFISVHYVSKVEGRNLKKHAFFLKRFHSVMNSYLFSEQQLIVSIHTSMYSFVLPCGRVLLSDCIKPCPHLSQQCRVVQKCKLGHTNSH